jgi:outer membrane immunogenic protein
MSDTSVYRCVGGAAVNKNRVSKNRVCGAIAFFVFGAFGIAGAVAEEMTAAPALILTSPSSSRPWTGLYIGGNGGYGWINSSASYSPNDPAAQAGTCGGGKGGGRCIPQSLFHVPGGFGGGQVGYDYQINSLWVAGVEADYQGANLSGQGASPFRLGYSPTTGANTNMTVNQSVSSFGTVRLRMGAAPINSLLLYGTGGLAFGKTNTNFNALSGGAGTLSSGGFSYTCGAAGTTCFSGSSSNAMVGWTIGGGAEFALSNNFTIKGEVLYVDLGSYNATVTATNAGGGRPASFTASMAPVGFVVGRGGLNFRF